MNCISSKQLARMGEFFLAEAMLDVLLAARQNGDCLGPSEISRRAGIFRRDSSGDLNMMNNAIVGGMLVKLHSEGRVRRCGQPGGKGGWELTDAEFDSRREDDDDNAGGRQT